MIMGSILVVCTGNICRSPVGEAALRSLLPEELVVSSAGTHAAVNSPAALETDEFVSRVLGSRLDHVSQQLTKEQAEAADLILTMTADHRAWVARSAPRAVRRTFILREFEEILTHLPGDQYFESVRDMALAASRLRSRVGRKVAELDIVDPYGGAAEGYESSFHEVLASSRQIAGAVTRYIPGA